MIRLTVGNQALFELWSSRCDEHIVPHIGATSFISDPNLGKNICIQFKAPDSSVRLAHAGSSIERLIGTSLTGVMTSDIYSGSEHEELSDMRRAKFLHPMIIHSQSSVTTLASELIQVEMLQLPFISQATDHVLYAIGVFEWTHAESKSSLGGNMSGRSLLSRTILDVKTLRPVESEFTFPPVEGVKKLKAVSAQELNQYGHHDDGNRIEL